VRKDDRRSNKINHKEGRSRSGVNFCNSCPNQFVNEEELEEFILILKEFVKKIEEKQKISQIQELVNSLSDEEKQKLRELLS
jgi:hypothetical protein